MLSRFSLFRFFPSFSSTPLDYSSIIPAEVWALIFTHLAPCFLFDVMRVSKRFNSIAQSDDVYAPKLPRYFPSIVKPDFENNESHFDLFADYYCDQFSTIEDPEARRLLSFLYEGDWEQIKNLRLTPELMDEKDVNGISIFLHIIRTGSQRLFDIVFYAIHQHYSPADEFKKNFYHSLSDSRVRYLSDDKYLLAAAFNQIEFLKKYRSLRDKVPHYQEALKCAIKYGHFEAADYIKSISYR